MAKRNNKHTRRVRNLVLLCAVCAVILTVSTYAWFIGMKTVNVSTFDIDIATTEGLFLSMDGESWSYELNAAGEEAYEGNTNTWARDVGLIPMSSIGDMDPLASRMKLYEKASLTTSDGGYRLLTSRVQNFATSPDDPKEFDQGKGYVAFDENGAVVNVMYDAAASETKGLGTKVEDPTYIANFIGMTNADDAMAVDTIANCTYSSMGARECVAKAITVYNAIK